MHWLSDEGSLGAGGLPLNATGSEAASGPRWETTVERQCAARMADTENRERFTNVLFVQYDVLPIGAQSSARDLGVAQRVGGDRGNGSGQSVA